MIFVTTGTQEPFDRLLKVILEFSETFSGKIIIQAKTKMSFPDNVEVYEFLEPITFNKYFNEADLIISHAGMGTIISALVKKKPLLITPRIASLGEHRNEHQLSTARKIKELNYSYVCEQSDDLLNELKRLTSLSEIKSLHSIENYASEKLLDSINDFINSKK